MVPFALREWQFGPKLGRAQELVYRGSFTEEATGSGVQFNRAYRVESRIFILDVTNRGLEAAFFTVLKQRGGPNERSEDTAPSSIRLELARVHLAAGIIWYVVATRMQRARGVDPALLYKTIPPE